MSASSTLSRSPASTSSPSGVLAPPARSVVALSAPFLFLPAGGGRAADRLPAARRRRGSAGRASSSRLSTSTWRRSCSSRIASPSATTFPPHRTSAPTSSPRTGSTSSPSGSAAHPASLSFLAGAAPDLTGFRFPLIIKPSSRTEAVGGRAFRLRVVDDQPQLDAFLAELAREHAGREFQLAENIPGDPTTLYTVGAYADRSGRCCAHTRAASCRSIRTPTATPASPRA